MNPRSAQRKLQRRVQRAIDSVPKDGLTVRQSALKCHLPKSTLHDAIMRNRFSDMVRVSAGRKPALTAAEENIIV